MLLSVVFTLSFVLLISLVLDALAGATTVSAPYNITMLSTVRSSLVPCIHEQVLDLLQLKKLEQGTSESQSTVANRDYA